MEIGEKIVDDYTKAICISNTLSSQPDMDAAICLNMITDITIFDTHGTPTMVSIPLTSIFHIFLSNWYLKETALSSQGITKNHPRQIIKAKVYMVTMPVIVKKF
jgi:hypothetical protein